MHIALIDNRSVNVGSKRVFIDGMHHHFKRLGVSSALNPSDYTKFDVLIYGKHLCQSFKPVKGKLIGLVNPECSSAIKWNAVDFVIVGSIEERDSLLPYCDTVLIFPLVELYPNKDKQHIKKSVLTLGYHGAVEHLNQLRGSFNQAIVDFSGYLQKQNIKLELHAIIGSHANKWTNRPSHPNLKIVVKPWRLKSIQDDLLLTDIGICPNNAPINNKVYKIVKQSIAPDDGVYKTDYVIRFKHKSNAGRAFVFHQLGIPVVASFTPSFFHILGNPNNGFVADTYHGYLHALKALASHKERTRIAVNAKAEFNRLYHMDQWVEAIVRALKAKRNT